MELKQLKVGCPHCGGYAYLDLMRELHWCYGCRCYILQEIVRQEATRDLYRSPAHDTPEPTQRRWRRWLMHWGPRLVAALKGRRP